VVVTCVVDAEFAVVDLGHFNFFGCFDLGYPIIREAITAINEVVPTCFVNEWADVFPDEFVFGCDFYEATVAAFGDEGVAVGEALDGADQGAVEFVVFDQRGQASFLGGVLPNDFEGERVKFDDAGMVAFGMVDALWGSGVGCAVTRHAAVVEEEDVAFSGKTFGNHVGVVLANDPTEFAVLIVGTDVPNNLACLFVGDAGDAGLATTPDDVVGVETFVAIGIPFVGAEGGHGVHVHPVAHVAGDHVGVASHGVAGFFTEGEVVEVFAANPFPNDVALPIDFDDGVVDEGFFADGGVGHIFVAQDEGVDFGEARNQTGCIISHWISGALVIVMLAGHPPGFFLIGVFDAFVCVKFPNDVAVPINLDEVEFVLITVFGIAKPCAAHHKSTGQYFGWKTCHALPFVNDVAVHVDEVGMTGHATGENGVAIVTLVGVVDGGAGWIDGWITHGTSEKNKRQKAKGKRQKAKGKRQKANGKRQTANGKRQKADEKSKDEKQTTHLSGL